MTAFRMPDTKWSYLMVNDSDAVKKGAVVPGSSYAPSDMDYYEVSREVLDQINKKRVEPLGSADYLLAKKNVIYVDIKPHSFVLLSDSAGY